MTTAGGAKRLKAPLGASLIVLSSFFYASYGVWVTLMGDSFGGYMASGLRALVVLLVLVPFALLRRRLGPMRWRANWPWLLGMVVASTLVWGPLYYAITHAGIGISLGVNYAALVIGMFIFGRLFAGEHFTRDKLISTCLGILGLWFVFSPSLSGAGLLALTAALASGLAGALTSVMWKKLSYNSTQINVLTWVIVAVVNLPLAILFGESLPALGWHLPWLYLAIFALTSLLTVQTTVAGLKLIEAGAAGILGLLEIVFAVVFGAVFFNERPDPVVLLGIATIIAAAAIPFVKDYNARKGTLDEPKEST